MNSAFVESLKELVRMVVTAVISFLLVDNAVNFLLVWIAGQSLDSTQVLFASGLLTALLKAIDKFLHKSGNDSPLDLKMMDKLK